MTTSVPTIAVKFHANDEQIEEVYGGSDDETTNSSSTFPSPNTSTNESKSLTSNIGDPDTSPFKYLPRLVKRSTSVDVSAQSLTSESPPADPWRFLSDIKGKITKSVEEKITEIKSRNTEEGSPLRQKPPTKESKENSSISDSEDLSESSISKTCGIVSTTEGVEMSSDDETPSLDKDKRDDKKKVQRKIPHTFSQRFRFLRKSSPKEPKDVKEVTVHVNSLSKLYNINAEKVEQALPEHTEEIESGVEALDDFESPAPETSKTITNEEIIKCVSQKIDNIDVDNVDDEKVVTVKEVTGREIRDSFFKNDNVTTIFAPSGFVDLRPSTNVGEPVLSTRHGFVLSFALFLYFVLDLYWPYMAGLILGLIVGGALHFMYNKLYTRVLNNQTIPNTGLINNPDNKQILEIQAVKEYQPLSKFEGWINEYPDVYNPTTYHISKTQSAYLRLQGNLLRISHTKHKIPKRAMWNEPEIKSHLIHHRIYNMIGAKVTLQPEGLAKIRHWSKKYPICITLSKDQLNVDTTILSKMDSEEEKEDKVEAKKEEKKSGGFRFNKKKEVNLSQRFSKLTEEEDYDLESDSRASSPSPDISDMPIDEAVTEDLPETHPKNDEELNEFDVVSSNGDSSVSQDDSPTENRIYIFGRTDREKEDWFRRLTAATHKQPWNLGEGEEKAEDVKEETETQVDNLDYEYSKYMQMFISKAKKPAKERPSSSKDKDKEGGDAMVDEPQEDIVLWLNALIGRVLFDCMHDPKFTSRVRDRIQRKLSAIKLPYFIEELLITELSLGKTSPMIRKAGKPVLDERGLWVDLDLTYDGLVVLTLMTKVNLMKLKNPPADKSIPTQIRSAIYHSDVDDSAESSSDEEGPSDPLPVETPTGGREGNSSKKFIKMVDKIAESRFFQAATDFRYIKKAMEGVSNTDLRLKVEMRSLVGTMVLNMPTPPSDRVWVGFRPVPELVLSAQPIVGEKNISFLYVTSWIEKKLVQEFQKIMVIPNMEDFIIPVMNAKLPE